jgi:hypothetical protein
LFVDRLCPWCDVTGAYCLPVGPAVICAAVVHEFHAVFFGMWYVRAPPILNAYAWFCNLYRSMFPTFDGPVVPNTHMLSAASCCHVCQLSSTLWSVHVLLAVL